MDYRAYSIGPDGHITGFEPIVSDDDEQAIAAANPSAASLGEFGDTGFFRATSL